MALLEDAGWAIVDVLSAATLGQPNYRQLLQDQASVDYRLGHLEDSESTLAIQAG